MLLVACALAPPCVRAAEPPAEATPEAARSAVVKWVETQQVIAREKRDWEQAKDLLEQRIALLEQEAGGLEAKAVRAREEQADTQRKRAEMIAEDRAFAAAASGVAGSIDDLEAKTRRLLGYLPDPIRERIRPLSQRLPDGPAAAGRLSLGQRYQNVIGILNEVNKFNNDVTVTREMRSLPDGTIAEVQALYLGLGAAYYVGTGGTSAGVGRPTAEGWQWTAANDLAPQIARAIAILSNEQAPAYVPLPVEIQ
jgi:hypothetical protein